MEEEGKRSTAGLVVLSFKLCISHRANQNLWPIARMSLDLYFGNLISSALFRSLVMRIT